MEPKDNDIPCTVYIRKVSTGEVRQHQDVWWADSDYPDYIWEGGNYACDCNRSLFFSRANNEQDDERPCGDTEFVIEKIVLETGEIVYSETGKK